MIDSCINIWQLFLSGDKAAFDKLMNLYFRPLFNYGSKFSDDKEIIKDTIQELFIRLWDRKDYLSKEVNPKAYLMASLRRALHRKIESQNRFLQYSDLQDDVNFFDFELSVEQKFIKNEGSANLARKVATKVAALPKRQKEVVYLKFFQEMSRDEISEAMGISPQTVSNLLQFALKKLRSELKNIILSFIAFISDTKRFSLDGRKIRE